GKIEMFDTVSSVFENAERLSEIGLDIPEVTKIAVELNKRGFNIPKNIFTVGDLRDAIVSLKGGNRL
ncbi:MAG: energy-coupling factor transporter ATPase, partial [Clostridia bacterium]|nr:energy-coupling factor transporter ATPase [Clostridia bacterium]